jgi:hypothetical protein
MKYNQNYWNLVLTQPGLELGSSWRDEKLQVHQACSRQKYLQLTSSHSTTVTTVRSRNPSAYCVEFIPPQAISLFLHLVAWKFIILLANGIYCIVVNAQVIGLRRESSLLFFRESFREKETKFRENHDSSAKVFVFAKGPNKCLRPIPNR